MKLYTEEQVRKAINDSSLYSYINGNFEFKNSEDDIINSLTPIKHLPNWEDVRKAIELATTSKYYHKLEFYSEEEIIEQLKQSKT